MYGEHEEYQSRSTDKPTSQHVNPITAVYLDDDEEGLSYSFGDPPAEACAEVTTAAA
jgi:hypothetical protein